MLMNLVVSDMYCTHCGQKNLPVYRQKSKERELGHLKKMFCIHCLQERNMVEIKSTFSKYTYEDFQLEFNYNNFNEEGTRKMPFKEFKKMLYKKGVIE